MPLVPPAGELPVLHLLGGQAAAEPYAVDGGVDPRLAAHRVLHVGADRHVLRVDLRAVDHGVAAVVGGRVHRPGIALEERVAGHGAVHGLAGERAFHVEVERRAVHRQRDADEPQLVVDAGGDRNAPDPHVEGAELPVVVRPVQLHIGLADHVRAHAETPVAQLDRQVVLLTEIVAEEQRERAVVGRPFGRDAGEGPAVRDAPRLREISMDLKVRIALRREGRGNECGRAHTERERDEREPTHRWFLAEGPKGPAARSGGRAMRS